MLVRGNFSKCLMVVPLAVVMAASASVIPGAARQAAAPQQGLHAPIQYFKLKNGLKVVLSRDTTTPTSASPCTTTSGSATSRRTGPASRISSST